MPRAIVVLLIPWKRDVLQFFCALVCKLIVMQIANEPLTRIVAMITHGITLLLVPHFLKVSCNQTSTTPTTIKVKV